MVVAQGRGGLKLLTEIKVWSWIAMSVVCSYDME